MAVKNMNSSLAVMVFSFKVQLLMADIIFYGLFPVLGDVTIPGLLKWISGKPNHY